MSARYYKLISLNFVFCTSNREIHLQMRTAERKLITLHIYTKNYYL